jgi:hypothetical protein
LRVSEITKLEDGHWKTIAALNACHIISAVLDYFTLLKARIAGDEAIILVYGQT